MKSFFVAIEGPIGVGKTTLARLLQPRFKAQLLLEAFEENPFLSDFYSDRSRYAFQTQMFFLLSRYRQQQAIPSIMAKLPVIADYTFGKDALFARLNLEGDELDMYGRLYTVLADRIVAPDLVIYLQADTDALMARIAARDRPYEREMDRDYIARVKAAYGRHFADGGSTARHDASSVLTIDTTELNYVQDDGALAFVEGRIREALGVGAYQQSLPQIEEVGLAAFRPVARAQAVPPQRELQGEREPEALRDFLAANEAVSRVGSLLVGQDAGSREDRTAHLRATLEQALERLTSLADSVGVDLSHPSA